MKLAICEDDAIINNLIVDYLEEMNHEVIASEHSEAEFMKSINEQRPDLVILDINLGNEGMEGVRIGKILQDLDIPFIYVTAYSGPTVLKEAITAEPLWYLVKPFTQAQLSAQVTLALANADSRKNKIQIHSGNHYMAIDLKELSYIESSRNYLIFHHNSSQKEPVKVRRTLKEVLDELPSYFLQIHRSFIVNKQQIESIEKDVCFLKDKSEIPVSGNFKMEVLSRLKSSNQF